MRKCPIYTYQDLSTMTVNAITEDGKRMIVDSASGKTFADRHKILRLIHKEWGGGYHVRWVDNMDVRSNRFINEALRLRKQLKNEQSFFWWLK